jgi:hypothetical protein
MGKSHLHTFAASFKKNKKIMKSKSVLLLIALYGVSNSSSAQDVHLHVNTKWEECSFQIDTSLTQKEWHRFSKEAASVLYFRPLTDAKPMGRGKYELSILQWNTTVDETAGAWNNTFVHPDSAHWLIGGEELPFPGLTFRTGITNKIDAGIYWSKSPGANYGVWGAQVQYNFMNDTAKHWSASARINFSSLYGPDDIKLNVCGADFLASKEFRLHSSWLSLAPYAGFSTFISHAHEKSDVVKLHDENVMSIQGMAGIVAKISIVSLGVEYNVAKVNTFSYKVGVAFKIKGKSR